MVKISRHLRLLSILVWLFGGFVMQLFSPSVVLVMASTMLPSTSSLAACPYGPDQCKPGYVWREAFSGDHVCVTGAQRSNEATNNRLALQRRSHNGGAYGVDTCKLGYVWREANPTDHVCVTGQSRADVALQNSQADNTVDPICHNPTANLNLHTEYLKRPLASVPAKSSYSYLSVRPDGTVVGISREPLAIATDLMWNPGERLTVSISGASAALQARIQTYALEWSKWANITLQFVADPAQAEIRVEVNSDNTSWSQIGRGALAVPAPDKTMNFGWLTDATADDEVSRVVLHEFGHALGLIHEHQSPVAGIPWDRDKVFAYYRTHDHWDDATIQSNIFDQASTTTTNFSQFDPASIMEYQIPAELTTNGYSVGFNRVLSAIDKQYIARFYPYPPGSQGTVFTGDDCDTVAFDVSNGNFDQQGVRFVLRLGPNVSWWKSIRIPTQGGGYQEVQAQDHLSGDTTVAITNLDPSRPIRFSKAKFLGVHTELGFTWDILPVMATGSRLILDWNRDHCGN